MKSLIVALLNLLMIFAISSCSEHARISRELAEFQDQTIVLPSAFHKVESGQVVLSKTITDVPIMILYNDSLSCSLCQIHQLYNKIPIYDLADSLGTFTVMTILSPTQDEYLDVITELKERDFDFPVYIDQSGDFRRINAGIPKDNRFHCFLIDRDGKPIFVGNPISNDLLWNLFCKTLNNLEHFIR